MNILIGVSHPKHVHIFKNVRQDLLDKGHKVKVLAVEKEITTSLLNIYNIPYDLIGTNQPTMLKKIMSLPKWEYKTYKIAKEFKPDIFISRALPHFAHVSTILNKPFIIFEDTETARALHKITIPFADAVVTPHWYKKNHGKKQIVFNSYFELGYLHPIYFKPNPIILKKVGLTEGDRFIIIRFIAWNATHDVSDTGFSDKEKLIKQLEDKCRVFISSEIKLPDKLEKYRITISPEDIHHLMYYAFLYIGESATMAAESAILGTPGILVSTLRAGNTDELEQVYNMVYSFSNRKKAQENALNKAIELMEDENIKEKWLIKREKLLNDNIDVVKLMVEIIENFN